MLRIEPAHARHSSNKFGSVLAQSQPSILQFYIVCLPSLYSPKILKSLVSGMIASIDCR